MIPIVKAVVMMKEITADIMVPDPIVRRVVQSLGQYVPGPSVWPKERHRSRWGNQRIEQELRLEQ
jgi:hypothetical protein